MKKARGSDRNEWGGRRPGAGRPPVPSSRRLSQVLNTRLGNREMKKLLREAQQAGLTPAAYAREVIQKHLVET